MVAGKGWRTLGLGKAHISVQVSGFSLFSSEDAEEHEF